MLPRDFLPIVGADLAFGDGVLDPGEQRLYSAWRYDRSRAQSGDQSHRSAPMHVIILGKIMGPFRRGLAKAVKFAGKGMKRF
ncbi:hypothetical protein AB0C27_10830 [Nonomuraea sp. NPDC048882]|uniref:hypothetical protein n=1 Tax=unclassified Nonomuraea TaxID=2593643 RepID=UPI00340F502C